ncbi:MAG: hypothetical protein ASARMPRED_000679 [Alectoria sarmentosa]|nr:MAG: hypothetical protein ASARMPRED_000679 [Alectoria sarmentosa]
MPPKKDKSRQATVEPESPDSGETGGEVVPTASSTGHNNPSSMTLIPGFSQEQVTGLMTMISAVVDARLEQRLGNFNTNRQQSSPFPSIEIPQPHQEQPHAPALRAEEVGYFDPEYQQKQGQQGPIVNAGKYVYYRDVYIFVDRLKDLAVTRNDVKSVMTACFRGFALM